jgi:hypothetical protein
MTTRSRTIARSSCPRASRRSQGSVDLGRRTRSQAQAFIDITEGNTFFPVVFIGQDEMEDNIRRIREATEEVMAD